MFWCKTKLDKTALLSRLGTISDALSAQESSQKSEVRIGFIFFINFISIYGESVCIVSLVFLICRDRDHRIFIVLHLSHQPLLLKFARFHVASSMPVSLHALINDEWEKWSSDLGRQFKQLSLFGTWKMADEWSLLARALKCSVFLSWSLRFVLPM